MNNFPFFQTSTNIYDPNILGGSSSSSNRKSKDIIDGSSSPINITTLLVDKNPNDTITVADMERILTWVVSMTPTNTSGGNNVQGGTGPTPTKGSTTTPTTITITSKSSNNLKTTPATTTTSTQSGIAFPQPSVISESNIQRGSTVAGSIVGLVIGITILPNLWLVGMVLGGGYGYDVAKKRNEGEDEFITDNGVVVAKDRNIIGRFLLYSGTTLARGVLQLYDYWKAMWFLYKTGQLSYEYYKTYESLDRRFEIQSKVRLIWG
jgi:hypothetical protein